MSAGLPALRLLFCFLGSRRLIAAARGRNAIPSDGGGTGKSDGND